MPNAPVKELNFFNHNYEKGIGWYHKRFKAGPWTNAEFSTLYFHDRNVPERIHRYNPEAKLVLALRNPIDRAFSQHRHEIRNRRVPDGCNGFWEGVANNPSYLEQGRYATHLERWLEFFPLSQILVVEFDEVRTRPADTARRLYEFVGVDPNFEPRHLEERVNIAVVVRSQPIFRITRTAGRAASLVLGQRIWSTVRRSGLPTRLRRANRVELSEQDVPPLTPEDRARLSKTFADENARLGRLLQRDYSHWQ